MARAFIALRSAVFSCGFLWLRTWLALFLRRFDSALGGPLAAWTNSGAVRRTLFVPVWLLLFHLLVVLYEEPVLRGKFGQSYDAYCKRTPRWIPQRKGLARQERLWSIAGPGPAHG